MQQAVTSVTMNLVSDPTLTGTDLPRQSFFSFLVMSYMYDDKTAVKRLLLKIKLHSEA